MKESISILKCSFSFIRSFMYVFIVVFYISAHGVSLSCFVYFSNRKAVMREGLEAKSGRCHACSNMLTNRACSNLLACFIEL